MSKSVLSSGLAIRAASVAASSMACRSKERPASDLAASVAASGRQAAEPTMMRASSTVLFLERRTAAATDRTGKSKEPRRRKDRKSTRLNSSHITISYAVFCLKKKKKNHHKHIHT